MLTLNQIIAAGNNFATAHGQVNYFGAGQIQDFATSGTTTYPVMWMDIEPSTLNEGVVNTVCRVYFFDRLLKGQGNLIDVMSDMQQVGLDLLAHFKSPAYFPQNNSFVDLSSISFNPIFEAFHDDEIAGWYFDMPIKGEFLENRCQIPFASLIPVTGSGGTTSGSTMIIGGGGTLNYVAKFTPDGTHIGNSLLFDNGTSQGIGTTNPSASSLLELNSTTQGLLVPRMTTTQRDAIGTPATALLIYNTTAGEFQFYSGSAWTSIGGGSSGWALNGNTVTSEKWIGTIDNFSFPVRTNNTERARVLSTGEVLINGTSLSSASGKLEVTTGGNTYGIVHTNGTIVGSTYIDGAGLGAGFWLGTKSNHPLYFYTNDGSAQMQVLTNGTTNYSSDVSANYTSRSLIDKGYADGRYGVLTGTLGQFAATTSAQLAAVISDEVGSGSLVFSTALTTQPAFCHASLNPADGLTYHFGVAPTVSAAPTSGAGRRYICTGAGTITSVYMAHTCTVGSTESVIFQIRNVTTATTSVISSAINLNTASQSAMFTITSLAYSDGDELEIQMVTPAWVTNPTSLVSVVIPILKSN